METEYLRASRRVGWLYFEKIRGREASDFCIGTCPRLGWRGGRDLTCLTRAAVHDWKPDMRCTEPPGRVYRDPVEVSHPRRG